MSTPSFPSEYVEPGPALVIAGINLAMAVNLAWLSLVLGDSGMRMLVGVRTHESVGETTSRQCSTVEHQPSTDARARQPKQRYTRSLAQRLRQPAHG
jgi:hypothetical protein